MIKTLYVRAFLAVAALLAAFALTGCGSGVEASDKTGDPGRVHDKSSETDTWTTGTGRNKVRHSDTEYDLVIKRPDGSTYEKDDVSETAYDRCKRGSKFPSCVGD